MNILERLFNYKDSTIHDGAGLAHWWDNPGATVFNSRLRWTSVILFVVITGIYELYLSTNYTPVDSNYQETDGVHTEYIRKDLPNGTHKFETINVGKEIHGYISNSDREFIPLSTFNSYRIVPPAILLVILLLINLVSNKTEHFYDSGYPDW